MRIDYYAIRDKEYDYYTKSEKLLKPLKNTAEKEEYYQRIDKEFRELETKIHAEKKDDLMHFKDEISMLIENEIISRYYFQDGRIQQSLNDDPDVLEALVILKNKERYDQILSGVPSTEIKN